MKFLTVLGAPLIDGQLLVVVTWVLLQMEPGQFKHF